MNNYSKMKRDAARIAGLTLSPCELEFRAFDLLELQGYVELADHAIKVQDRREHTTEVFSFTLGALAEPSTVLQLHVDAS